MVFNPTEALVFRELELPLYDSGLAGTVRVSERDGAPRTLVLTSSSTARLDVTLPPGGITWFTFVP